jgi:uncharacterized protein YoxC
MSYLEILDEVEKTVKNVKTQKGGMNHATKTLHFH